LIIPVAARADFIFLKDGTVLQGKIIQESSVEFDQTTHEPVRLASGFFLVDDGPRRTYFCQNQVSRVVTQKEQSSEVRFINPSSAVVAPRTVPPIWQVTQTEPCDGKWNRKIRLICGNSEGQTAPVTVKQHLGVLTPRFAKMDAITLYSWADYYLT